VNQPTVPRPPVPTRGLASVSRLSPPRVPEQGTQPLDAVQGTLALDLDCLPAPGDRPLPLPPAPLVAVDGGGGATTVDPVEAEVRIWAHRFAQAVVEVTAGDRPLTQLLRWTSARVYQDLARRVQVMARTRNAPVRRRTIRAQVRSVHVFQPSTATAEVSVHVRYGQRSRAIAARLERRRGAWTCTVLQLG
jgi:uncharacterized protein DUF6459